MIYLLWIPVVLLAVLAGYFAYRGHWAEMMLSFVAATICFLVVV